MAEVVGRLDVGMVLVVTPWLRAFSLWLLGSGLTGFFLSGFPFLVSFWRSLALGSVLFYFGFRLEKLFFVSTIDLMVPPLVVCVVLVVI